MNDIKLFKCFYKSTFLIFPITWNLNLFKHTKNEFIIHCLLIEITSTVPAHGVHPFFKFISQTKARRWIFLFHICNSNT